MKQGVKINIDKERIGIQFWIPFFVVLICLIKIIFDSAANNRWENK